jgi:hypothetical protein
VLAIRVTSSGLGARGSGQRGSVVAYMLTTSHG